MPEADTVERIARIDQGRFQRLCDIILPGIFPELQGLKPNGINDDDRTTRGNPDSYVGPTPEACTIAVEYNVWRGRIAKKLKDDYRGVLDSCEGKPTIYLVSAGSMADVDLSDTTQAAESDGVRVVFVDGPRIARHLDEQRQDVRFDFVNIPVRRHTQESLVSRLASVITDLPLAQERATEMRALFARREADRRLSAYLAEQTPSWCTVHGTLGVGKSTWAVATASRFASGVPTVFIEAKDLVLTQTDPVAERVALAAYGASAPERVIELAELLFRQGERLIVIIDGVEEVADYIALGRALRDFRQSAIYPRAHVVLVYRSEAAPLLQSSVLKAVPARGRHDDPREIELAEIREHQVTEFLLRSGATATEAAAVRAFVPREFRGRPLFLQQGLAIVRHGGDTQDRRFAAALVQRFVDDIYSRLGGSRQPLGRPRIRRALGVLAWNTLQTSDESLDPDTLADRDGELWADDRSVGLAARCVQAGLLFRRERNIAFAHTLFQSAFAAEHCRAWAPERWTEAISPWPPEALRSRLVSVASLLDPSDSLLQALASLNVRLAMECCASGGGELSADVVPLVVTSIGSLLGSQFPSDVRRGLRLLSRIPIPEARRAGVDWFNALNGDDRLQWAHDAADLFLAHEVAAIDVILMHFGLMRAGDSVWLGQALQRRIGATSPQFQKDLADLAWLRVESDSQAAPAMTLLAILKDPRLVVHLGDRFEQDDLDGADHRLLIHINSPESLSLFAESVQRWLDRRYELPRTDDKEVRERARKMFYQTIIKQSDIRMFPHDCLSKVVDAALSALRPDIVAFGLAWASTLADVSLLDSWHLAFQNHGQNRHPLYWHMSLGGHRPPERIVECNGPDGVVDRVKPRVVGEVRKPSTVVKPAERARCSLVTSAERGGRTVVKPAHRAVRPNALRTRAHGPSRPHVPWLPSSDSSRPSRSGSPSDERDGRPG